MTPEAKELVQQTWSQVEPISEAAAQLFYGRLFELDPQVAPLFAHSDMKEQGKKLMQALTVVVRGLDRIEQLIPALQTMGRRHVTYGVKDEHYETVGAALLWTLEQGLGAAFTPSVRQAWTDAYVAVATVMRQAAAEPLQA